MTDTDATAKKHFVMIDVSGNPLGFYPSDIWPTPPAGAVEITEDQYRQWLDGQGANPCQRYQLVAGALVAYSPPPASLTLEQKYAAAIAAGLVVTSAMASLAAVAIALTSAQLTNMANVSLYIQVNNRFPAGQASMPLATVGGDAASVPSKTAWQMIATAAADYVTLCDLALAAARSPGGSWIAPSNVVTIA